MGDLVTEAVSGTLYYAEKSVFDRVLSANATTKEKSALVAVLARLNPLYLIANAGSGHIGSSFSSLDLVTWLSTVAAHADDVFFSSKGHDAPGLYSVLIAKGILPFEKLHQLRRIDGLPGHPDIAVPGMVTNTGSLGMGISKAKGMVFANRLKGEHQRIYVMTGDGELQEGQIWESMISAAYDELGEITAIVDHNKIQSDYSVERTSSLGDLNAKFAAFGWHVIEINGHDYDEIEAALSAAEQDSRPTAIIAHTIKGKGVSFMEGVSIDSDVERFKFHSGAPQADDYRSAVQELVDRINNAASSFPIDGIAFERVLKTPSASPGPVSRLFPSYTEALINLAEQDQSIVALDADLVLDMGLEAFRDQFPNRFVECGIAEMDMVSQAGGMALNGLKPIAHSFSCFLSTRPNEQIYNNATEGTQIVYVGGLSGVLPGGPGHSHQSVREISCVGSIPNMMVVEPSHPDEVAPLLDWCVKPHTGSSFMRLVSIPFAVKHSVPEDWNPVKGYGYKVRSGHGKIAIISAGLVGVSQSIGAADLLSADGVDVSVFNLPFLNQVDLDYLRAEIRGYEVVVVVVNHNQRFGQGDVIGTALAELPAQPKFKRIGLSEVPKSGTNDEVLETSGLDTSAIAAEIRKFA